MINVEVKYRAAENNATGNEGKMLYVRADEPATVAHNTETGEFLIFRGSEPTHETLLARFRLENMPAGTAIDLTA